MKVSIQSGDHTQVFGSDEVEVTYGLRHRKIVLRAENRVSGNVAIVELSKADLELVESAIRTFGILGRG